MNKRAEFFRERERSRYRRSVAKVAEWDQREGFTKSYRIRFAEMFFVDRPPLRCQESR